MASDSSSSTDRIERQILLKAPRERIWRALSDPAEFGAWFGVVFDPGAAFTPGTEARGHITHPGYEHLVFTALIDRVEPQRVLSFRWHPYAIDPAVDYSKEPMTRVEFTLDEGPGGILLRIVESGFDAIPESRRASAFAGNSKGWEGQLANIGKHLAQAGVR